MSTPAPETLDELVGALQTLRSTAGGVTYDELASRITHNREARGLSPATARVARSTIYDAFQSGRTRINAQLVAEIVRALGEREATAEQWRQRCLHAAPSRTSEPVPTTAVDRFGGPAVVGLIMVASVGLNLFGNATAARVGTPLFLDMIGTAVVAIAFGPWYGAAVGLSSNLLAALSNGPETLPFALVNVVGALVWGYGVRAWGLGRTPLRFLALNLIVAVACTATAIPILALLFDGTTAGGPAGGLFGVLQSYGASLWAATITSNFTVSVADKVIAGFIALAVTHVLRRTISSHLARAT